MVVSIPPIVRVAWNDAHSIDPWTDLSKIEEESEFALVETVGYLVLDKPDRIALAACVDPDANEVGCIVVIPRKMIVDGPYQLMPGREEA